jgi:hypothetical protein
MPATNTPTPNITLIAERLEGLRQEMQDFRRTNADDLRDLKVSNAELAQAVRTLAETYKVEHVKVIKDVEAHERRIAALDDPEIGKVTTLSKEIVPLMIAYRVMLFIFSILAASVVALIWGMLTHTITMVTGVPLP